ncbi:MAG: hypothetical protein QGH13_04305 [Candidatus Thalassarchaeaceae archaeon]|jgi:hypothetical protein|nr:hypothetical protein [Candidatus Thalassarchaeaceae archaeon]|tara:strand:- start:60 stop:560 length:501 start_codon:yes stop_codon:yes gene_type:complete
MRAVLGVILGTLLIAIPSVSAEIYIPGPEEDSMMDPNEVYEYTLPNWMDEVCLNTLACRYETTYDKNIVHTYYGINQGATLELSIIQGEAQTYNITVSSLEIEPESLTITTGSTLIFTVANNDDNSSNIILPWNEDKPEETETTPGFGAELIVMAVMIAIALRRNE